MKKAFKICLLFLVLLLIAPQMNAQKKFRKYLITGSAMFVSGMLDGTIETIQWHYDQGFKPKFPNANQQFWNPALSWKNKYKGNDPAMGPKFYGSTTAFAFTTDAYHLLRTVNRAINTVAIAGYANSTYKSKQTKREKLKTVITDFLILTAIRSAGFTLTYGVMFKVDPGYGR